MPINKYKIMKEYHQNLMYIQDILGDGATTDAELNKHCKTIFGSNRFVGVF